MRFEWDQRKDKSNRAKHGISFSEACGVFADSMQLNLFDPAHSQEEERWTTLGTSLSGRLLVVIHTYKERGGRETVRIISARKATSNESRDYFARRK